MSDKSSDKARLATELLELLKGDISARAARDKDKGDTRVKFVKAGSETMAGGHQKRDNKRFEYPVLRVVISGATYETLDWSIGGLACRDYVGTLKQYARVKCTVSDGKEGSTYYQVECRVARVDLKKRMLSLQFQNLSRQMFDWLSGMQMMQTKRRA